MGFISLFFILSSTEIQKTMQNISFYIKKGQLIKLTDVETYANELLPHLIEKIKPNTDHLEAIQAIWVYENNVKNNAFEVTDLGASAMDIFRIGAKDHDHTGQFYGYSLNLELIYRFHKYIKRTLHSLQLSYDMAFVHVAIISNQDFSPLLETIVANILGKQLSDFFKIPFYFPSPFSKQTNSPEYWEQNEAITCPNCKQLFKKEQVNENKYCADCEQKKQTKIKKFSENNFKKGYNLYQTKGKKIVFGKGRFKLDKANFPNLLSLLSTIYKQESSFFVNQNVFWLAEKELVLLRENYEQILKSEIQKKSPFLPNFVKIKQYLDLLITNKECLIFSFYENITYRDEYFIIFLRNNKQKANFQDFLNEFGEILSSTEIQKTLDKLLNLEYFEKKNDFWELGKNAEFI
ncbi:MAG: hypothetical protein EAZ97_05515 [Bacteroidetes bacterium]|nr:MAG: hypothetical protein EAZ97_05515 [Bacteroidota bacterium]